MSKDPEKRKYKRAQTPCVIEFQIKPGESREKDPTESGMVVVEDLGAGGVSFNYNRNLEAGSLIDLKIAVSSSMPPVNCVGKIIRIIKQPDSNKLGVAVELTDISEQEKDVINEVVEKSLK